MPIHTYTHKVVWRHGKKPLLQVFENSKDAEIFARVLQDKDKKVKIMKMRKTIEI